MDRICAVVPLVACCSLVSASPERVEEAVAGADELAPFFEGAATRRVDMVGIGDSNQLFQAHGWDEGWILALDDRFDTYATSLIALGENGGNGTGAGAGFRMFSTLSQGAFEYTGAPSPLDDYLTGPAPLGYVYIPEGVTVSPNNHGMFIETNGPIDTSARLLFTTTQGVFAGTIPGSGIRPHIRRGNSPFNGIAFFDGFAPTTGPGWGVEEVDLVLEAAPRNFPLQCMVRQFLLPVTGPFIGYYMRVQETETLAGASFSSLYANGGQSARDMASALLGVSNDTLTLYFDTLRDDQGDDPLILVRINTGLNDRNEQLDPIGIDAVPDSPEAFEQHINLIIDRIEGIWALNGWPEDEVFFCITVSHPVDGGAFGVGDDPELIAYRDRARAIADQRPRCVALDLTALTSADELVDNSWYATPSDRNHLKRVGFIELATRELSALQNGRSWYDADDDGAITVEDLYTLEQSATQPADAPEDLSAEGLRRAVRFGETTDALARP